MDIDEPLDFEAEDLQLRPSPLAKKRKQVINLDDLLNDHMKEKDTPKDKRKKKGKLEIKNCNSDDDEDSRVVMLSECVDRFQKEIGKISSDDEIHTWGLHMFRNQNSPPPSTESYELERSSLFQSFMSNELNLILELDITKGDDFFERLLINGWLTKLVLNYGHVESSIALWTFGKVMYSSDQVLSTSACDFWCEILTSEKQVKIDWLPCFSEIKTALGVYGFKLDSQDNMSSAEETTDEGSYNGQPPQNIRTWIKYIASCFRVRGKYQLFSISEAEELLVDVGYLFLDRLLTGLSVILSECLLSAVSFFTDSEWSISCEKIAHSLAHSLPKDMNCLRIVEIIPAVNVRSKHLRRTIAFHMLQASFDNQTSNSEEMLRIIGSIVIKDDNVDLFKVYIRLSLAENWLLCNPLLETSAMSKLWNNFLRNCSCQITVSDIRPYSSKVRSKASYLLQGYTLK